MNIIFRIAKIVIDDKLDHWNIDASGRHVCANQYFNLIIFKFIKGFFSLWLTHVTMKTLNIKAKAMEN